MKEGLAPSACVGCGGFGEFLCEQCTRDIAFVDIQTCMYCERLTPLGKTCGSCRNYLDGLYVLARLDLGPLKDLIHHYKYGKAMEIESVLKSLMASDRRLPAMMASPVICAVPLHRSRQRSRGFNQAERVGRILAQRTGWKLYPLLRRIKPTVAQVGLSRSARLHNLQDAFVCPFELGGRNVLVVDDVATTGATLEECARVLKAAGAGRVWGWVVARGTIHG